MLADWWDYYFFGYEAPQGGSGMATTLPTDEQRDYGQELRDVVREVTGKEVEPPAPRRIGFL